MREADKSFWAAGRNRDGRRVIEDYALIGDCETAALVSREGSVDWLCWPRFDSGANLAALLGSAENGFWRVAPASGIRRCTRRYRPQTLILEQRLECDEGAVLLTDFMPLRGKASDLVRIVEGLSGRVPMRSVLDLRFFYGRLRPLLRRIEELEISALAGPHAVVLRSEHPLAANDSALDCDFTVREGERATFVLTYFPSHCEAPEAVPADESLAGTEKFWTEWAGRCRYQGPHRESVVRSLITLKALTYRPTGGTVAAATSSLPELPGGQRNWDYRYCWLRDAAFMLLSFIHGGYPREAQCWRDWLLRAVAGEPADVRPLFTVDGGRDLHEFEADWLSGFNDSRPVRFGNAAHGQLQIDVFGEVIDAFHLARRHGLQPHEESWRLQRALLDTLLERWPDADSGFWEVRSDPEHFVHSKAMAWAAFDRGVRSFDAAKDRDRVARWADARDKIRRMVMDRGYDPERNCFVRAFGSSALDATSLLLPLVGLIDPRDPKAIGTVAAIERELMPGGLVRRYDPATAADGLDQAEGEFIACSFWMVDNLHLQGRRDDAAALFEKLVGLANDVGLLSEEYSTGEQRLLGNFPQALSHVGLINSAFNLSEGRGPAEDRLHLRRNGEEAEATVNEPAEAGY